jgi:hypothetical protein
LLSDNDTTRTSSPAAFVYTMKFTAAILLLAASTVSAGSISKLLQSARRLEDGQADNEYAFLQSFSLKMLTCKTGSSYVNPNSGETETSSVVFRLCPTTGECSDDGTQGCSSGYGDYVIGLNTFVQEYLEDKRDDMQNDDNFKVEQLGECRQYEGDKDGDEDNNVYYVGPACSSDGTSVKVGLFSEETCSTPVEGVTFEEISNGISLPYSEGGLVANYCESCNNVNDKGELSDFCMNLYMYSGKCESKMELYHASGKSESSCEAISALVPKMAKSRGRGGKIVGWIFFIAVACALGAFAFTAMKKKKDEKSFGLMT